MAYPRRIVHVRKTDGKRSDWLQHGGQEYRMCERSIAANRGWVWVWEQEGTPGSAPGLILYDAPSNGKIIGRADPVEKWPGVFSKESQ